ncbi:hypothetical protein ACFL3E_02295 [Patescibacteria group bacterium]
MAKLKHYTYKTILIIVAIVSNLIILPIALYNAYYVGNVFLNDGGIALAAYVLFAGALLPSSVTNYFVGIPVFVMAVLALVVAPWGILTGIGVFLSFFGAKWASPKIMPEGSFEEYDYEYSN